MKEDIDILDLTKEDFQALLEDIKKRREKYRESLDEEKKEDKIMDKNYYDYVLEKFLVERGIYPMSEVEKESRGIFITSYWLEKELPIILEEENSSWDIILQKEKEKYGE